MSLLERLHGSLVYGRRVRVLAEVLAPLLPPGRTLDVGSGDGLLARALADRRRDVEVEGVDVLVRPETHIRVREFDGRTLPFADGSYDAALLVDVLHHTSDPEGLLREAARVARTCVVLKDHVLEGALALPTLRLMDRVGNARHGVALPYRYLRPEEWEGVFARLGMEPMRAAAFRLYPPPLTWLFDRSLHFAARLDLG